MDRNKEIGKPAYKREVAKEHDGDKKLIRFDWASKRLLRDKANFSILEGLLSSLLGRDIKIKRILESESNREYEENKSNRVDLLCEEEDGTHILIEVQNETEASYFHRMLFATSRIISEYLKSGDNYDKVTKIYSINIVYFPLGVGQDYVFKGKTEFRGIHDNELLRLPPHLKVKYGVDEISDLYPEYYILRVSDFDKWSKVPLDQWMYFLSSSTIPADADAPGLQEARELLRVSQLSIEERDAYYEHMRAANSWHLQMEDAMERGIYIGREEGRAEGIAEGRAEGIAEGRAEGIAEGREEGRAQVKIDVAVNAISAGLDNTVIAQITGLSFEEINRLRNK